MENRFSQTIVADTNARYLGVPIDMLMEKAGEGIAKALLKKYGKDKTYGFVCGLGNNGGDGFAGARHLANLGVKSVCVYLVGRPGDIKSSSALAHWENLKKMGQKVEILADISAKDVQQADVSVECLLGSGFKGKLHKRFHDIIVRLTRQKTKIVAVDVPVPGYKYDFSISMAYPKTDDAVIVDVGMPKEVELFTGPGDIKVLDVPKSDSYKSQNGELLVYAGSEQFHGAPEMAIKAASKIIGSIFFYTNPENRELVLDLKKGINEFIVCNDNSLEKYARYANAFLFGPGLEENLPTKGIISALLREFPEKPAILDAYAISVAREKDLLKNKILTPHRGELRHIFGEDISKKVGKEALEGRLKRFAVENQCYIILKGSIDILFSKEGDVVFNKSGNQGMAKGGTGDVLAGILGALLTKNDPWIAMRAATFINGKAGDNLFEKFGYNYSATDLITEIQSVIKWGIEY